MIVKENDARFRVLNAGRRFGKSLLALEESLDEAINNGGRVWWISPTFTNAMSHWRNTKRMLRDLPGMTKSEQLKHMEFDLGGNRVGELGFKSGDRPDNLRGEGLTLAVIDEAAFTQRELWENVVRPALSDKRGRALIISTPNGASGWYYDAYMRGQDAAFSDEWKSWTFSTADNKAIPGIVEEVEKARRELPQFRFRQEYLAEFIAGGGLVFEGLDEVAVLRPLNGPREGQEYVFGVDFARLNDYTVVSVVEITTGRQVRLYRFQHTNYEVQAARMGKLAELWRPKIIWAESNSIAMGFIERLKAMGLPVRGVYMTNQEKTGLVEKLAVNIAAGRIRLLAPKFSQDAQRQFAELIAFKIYKTPSGMITYRAPGGQHDDHVVSLMLSNKSIRPFKAKAEFKTTANPFFTGGFN